MLGRPHPPGPSQACLDLVEDHQDTVPVADLPDLSQEVLRWDNYPPLALDRLEHYGGGVGLQRRLERSDIAVLYVLHVLENGLEGLLVLLAPGGREGTEGLAVISS